jgi:exonuclease III
MKLITWNCNMAFRKKAAAILVHKPDLLIVPECEHPARLIFPTGTPIPTDIVWYGKNPNKGLGIFSYSKFRFMLMKDHNPKFKMILPIAVTDGKISFNLFAIWANNPQDKDGPYVEQVWKALHHYESLVNKRGTILAGDFNSNTIWDREHRVSNHSAVVKLLEEKGISSCYHAHHGQVQGSEAHPTLYMYRHKDKPYHLDYCFVSNDFSKRISAVEVGDHETWSQYSDHVPLMVTFSTKGKLLKMDD